MMLFVLFIGIAFGSGDDVLSSDTAAKPAPAPMEHNKLLDTINDQCWTTVNNHLSNDAPWKDVHSKIQALEDGQAKFALQESLKPINEQITQNNVAREKAEEALGKRIGDLEHLPNEIKSMQTNWEADKQQIDINQKSEIEQVDKKLKQFRKNMKTKLADNTKKITEIEQGLEGGIGKLTSEFTKFTAEQSKTQAEFKGNVDRDLKKWQDKMDIAISQVKIAVNKVNGMVAGAKHAEEVAEKEAKDLANQQEQEKAEAEKNNPESQVAASLQQSDVYRIPFMLLCSFNMGMGAMYLWMSNKKEESRVPLLP